MATNVSITTNYNGIEAGNIIAESFKDAQTIEKNLISVLTSISDGKASIRLIEGENGLTDYACGWVPQGTLTLSEKVLEPKKLMIEQQFCKQDFRGTWDGPSMGYGAWNNDLPKDTKVAVLNRVMDQLAESVDSLIWTGSATQSGQFGGFIPKLEADAATIDVTGTTVTAANVIAELTKVYTAIPENIYGKEDLVIVVSQNIYKAYIQAQNALGYKFLYYNNPEFPVDFNGIRIEMVNGLPSNTMLAYRIPNLVMGTALTSDFNEVRIIDTDQYLLDDMVRIKVLFSADTQIAYAGEVVLYN